MGIKLLLQSPCKHRVLIKVTSTLPDTDGAGREPCPLGQGINTSDPPNLLLVTVNQEEVR